MGQVPQGFGLWLSSPNTALLEMAALRNVDAVVLDLEHGTFSLSTQDAFILTARSLGLPLLAKARGPDRASIQQPLDFGATGVIIPHIGGFEHAREVTAFAKYPPLGTRSSAGGRIARYQGVSDDFFFAQNSSILCLPMIETADALADVEQIAKLATVDGLFVGPTDLSLRRGRGRYLRSRDDREDIEKIASAAAGAGKPWILPAWTEVEREWGEQLGAELMIVAEEQAILYSGLGAVLEASRA